ncbi:MAG: hypothetical protein LPK26_03180 [Bacillaceae bacterium]|nr:hypothetical protein [Bacillaceae bacterium]
MESITYYNRSLGATPSWQFEMLKLLLPYWGLQLYGDTTEIRGGLEGYRVYVSEANDEFRELLTQRLEHTKVQLETQPQLADLIIQINYNDTYQSPLTIHEENRNYFLKPKNRISSSNLQQVIHQNIWLPFKKDKLSISVWNNSQTHLIDWLVYIIIQSRLQVHFQPLAGISLSDFQQLKNTILKNINQSFYLLQETILSNQDEWPQPPPLDQVDEELSFRPKPGTDNKTFNPFKTNQHQIATSPLNPFKNNSSDMKPSKINPFKKK